MKQKIIVVIFVSLLFLFLHWFDGRGGFSALVESSRVNSLVVDNVDDSVFAYDFELQSMFSFGVGGVEYKKLSDIKDKVVVVNFWATWCPPCVKELPLLIDFAREHKGDVVLILLSQDNTEQVAKSFIEENYSDLMDLEGGLLSNVVVQWDRLKDISFGLFKVAKYPETIIFDRGGVLNSKIVGELRQENLQEIERKLILVVEKR